MIFYPFRYLSGKNLLWTKYVRIFCDGGQPIYNIFPRFHLMGYDPHWNMKGFVISWVGRQFFFSFGEDINGLYKR